MRLHLFVSLLTPLLLAPSLASACGGFFCGGQPLDQTGEHIVFVHKGDTIETHVQIGYEGDAEEFSWVVPVPGVPDLDVGTDELFRQLLWSTAPTLATEVGDHDCAGPFTLDGWWGDDDLDSDADGLPSETEGGGGGVEVLAELTVGAYEATVVGAEDAEALLDWFNCNDYRVAYSDLPRIEAYLAGGMNFLALKLTSGADSGDILPLVMEYEADRPMIPLVLTAVATRPNLVVRAWFVHERRAVPLNYDHVWLNDARRNPYAGGWWGGTDASYTELVSKAVDDAGGQAFVTDYAGPSDLMVDRIYPRPIDLSTLPGLSDPAAWVSEALRLGLPRNALMRALLRRFIPMPQELIDNGTTEQQFYNNLSAYSVWFPLIDFDPVALTAEVEVMLIEPMERANAIFDPSLARASYLTRLSTTLSGWEMELDPAFTYLPNLDLETEVTDYPWFGSVPQTRSLPLDFEGGDPTVSCWNVGQVMRTENVGAIIEFGGEDIVTGLPAAEDLPSCLALPAATLVERFTIDGLGSLVSDFRGDIRAAAPTGYCRWETETMAPTTPPPGIEWPPDGTFMPLEEIPEEVCAALEGGGVTMLSDVLPERDLWTEWHETWPGGEADPEAPEAPGNLDEQLDGSGRGCSQSEREAAGPLAGLAALGLLGLWLRRRRAGRGLQRALAALGLLGLIGCATPLEDEYSRIALHEPAPQGDLADWERVLEQAGVEHVVLAAGADDALIEQAAARPRFSVLSAPGVEHEGGVAGVRLSLSGGADAGLSSPEVWAAAAECEEAGQPLVLEVALGAPTRQLALEALLAAHPELTVVLAHFGGLGRQIDRLDRLLRAWPQLYVDVSVGEDPTPLLRAVETRPDVFRTFFRAHRERVLWAAGCAWRGDADALAARLRVDFALYQTTGFSLDGRDWTGLGLEPAVLERLYRENALELLGGTLP